MAPRVDEFGGFVIRIHLHDHGPPHVHVRKGNAELRVYLDDEHAPEAVFGHMKFAEVRIAVRIIAKRRLIYLKLWEEIGPQ